MTRTSHWLPNERVLCFLNRKVSSQEIHEDDSPACMLDWMELDSQASQWDANVTNNIRCIRQRQKEAEGAV